MWKEVKVTFLLSLIPLILGSNTDWTQSCPSGCDCRWIGGKKTAECRDGGFTSIPVGLSDEVQALDLRGNNIPTLRNYVFRDAGLLNLNKIKMTNSGIQRVERHAFAELKLLIELDLSENAIREVTMESFETNARLRELQLNGNPLSELHGIGFPPLLHFQKLSLRNCSLSKIPSHAFEQLTTLVEIDLSENQFETLSDDLFRHLVHLKGMGLHENPWNCDCRLKTFRDWALNNRLLGVQPTKCATPERLANFEWSQLLTSHFACAPLIETVQISGQATEAYIVGDVGKRIRLECLVKANPPPGVRWVKDSVAMTNGTAAATGKSYFVQVSGETERWVNLTLTNTQLSDAGEYTCVGENKGGSAEKNITLNFEDVPSGAGVGIGMGSEGVVPRSRTLLWILIGTLTPLLLLIILIILIFCSKRNRRPTKDSRTQSVKGLYQVEPLVSGEDTLDEGSKVNHQRDPDEGTTPLLSPARPYGMGSGDPDYPDLLDIPRPGHPLESPVGSTASRSTLPDSTRFLPQPHYSTPIRPQELNPSALYDPSRNSLSLYAPSHLLPRGRPHSPYSGSVASFASEPPLAIVPPAHRPGYVTLPRRPRVPAWSPASQFSRGESVGGTPLSPSPTGSGMMGNPFAKYDNLGPRTTADGSSRLSLDKLGAGTPGTPGNYPSSTLPAYSRGRGLHSAPPIPHYTPASNHFNFAPIEENEGASAEQYGLPSPTSPHGAQGKSGKKVPPKPPPKPKKLDHIESPSPASHDGAATLGDDGTEV